MTTTRILSPTELRQAGFDEQTIARLMERRRRDRERKRALRYLKQGGVVERDEVGGAVGVRWAKATRSGSFYAPVLEHWMAAQRLVRVDGSEKCFRLVGASA